MSFNRAEHLRRRAQEDGIGPGMRQMFATLATEAQLERIADALERAHPADVRPDPVVLPYRMRGRAFPVNQEGLDQLCANIDALEARLRELGVEVAE